MMSARAEALARKVETANKELLATIERSSDDQWTAKCADGDWTQGFVGYHAATSIGNITQLVKSIAAGQPNQPITFDQIDQMNALFHGQHANATKQDAVDMVRANSPAAVAMVKGLSDAELDRTTTLAVGMPPASVEQIVEMLLVGHPTNHMESIRKAR